MWDGTRLPTVRRCLLTISMALLGANVSMLALDVGTPWATATQKHADGHAARRMGNGRSSSAHPGKCVGAMHGGKRDKRGKRCTGKNRNLPRTKARARELQPSPTVIPRQAVGDGSTAPVTPLDSPEIPRPAPVGELSPVEPAPAEPTPPQTEPEPAPTESESTPTQPEPTPAEAEPTPEPGPAPSESEAEPVTGSEPVSGGWVGPFRFFSPSSFWNGVVSGGVLLASSSAAVVGAFDEGIAKGELEGKGPGVNTTSWSVPVYTVSASQPVVKVALVNASRMPALQSAWAAVPLPAGAHPATGTDKHLVVWQPSTDRLWEFYKLEQTVGGWQASWGGAIQSVSSNSGAYGPEAWSGATGSWGASACSLSIAGGLITLEDLALGKINHALAMAVPAPRGGVYASPAERTDGWSSEPLSLPEGAHLRLDPSLDLAALHLPRFTLMVAEAAQRYGIFVRDAAAKVVFYGQDPTPTATNPYTGPNGYFEGKTPQQLLAAFPWKHLQLIQSELH